MAFSDIATQQRDREATALKRFVTCSIAGSLVLHGAALLLKVNNLWNLDESDSAEIAIVVTEPLIPVEEPELEEATPAEEPLPASESELPFSEPGSASSSSIAVADLPVEPIPEPEEPEPSAVVEPLEELLEEEPLADEVTEEEVSDTVEPESIETEAVEEPVPSPSDVAEERQDLRELLDQVRRNRQNRQPQRAESDRPAQSGRATPSASQRGESAQGERNQGEQATAPTTPGIGNGEGDAPEGDGSGSRQVGCRSCPRPEYPESALDAGAEGQVSVSVDVGPDGRVIGVTLTGTSGNPDLDQAVLQTIREQYQFEGVSEGGETIPVVVDMTIQGSERNRRARQQGERTEIELPGSEPPAQAESPVEPPIEPALRTPDPETPAVTPDPAASPEAAPTEAETVPSPDSPTVESTPLPELPAEPEEPIAPVEETLPAEAPPEPESFPPLFDSLSLSLIHI
ncbi:hypothetical protein C7B76_31605, partial [filamentous cyanobacterium CCP2]